MILMLKQLISPTSQSLNPILIGAHVEQVVSQASVLEFNPQTPSWHQSTHKLAFQPPQMFHNPVNV
jgi:hypothetical protein